MRNHLILAAMIACGLGPGAGSTSAQEPAPAQHASAPAAKKPKVWTNEDVTSLRSPADAFVREKGQQEEQAAAAKQAASSPTQTPKAKPEGMPNVPAPTTVEQADQLIAQQKADLAYQQEFVEQTKRELADAPESQKPKLNGRIEYHNKVIERIQTEIADLQAARESLAKKPASNTESGASAGSNSPQRP